MEIKQIDLEEIFTELFFAAKAMAEKEFSPELQLQVHTAIFAGQCSALGCILGHDNVDKALTRVMEKAQEMDSMESPHLVA